jgi:hypothetical protein
MFSDDPYYLRQYLSVHQKVATNQSSVARITVLVLMLMAWKSRTLEYPGVKRDQFVSQLVRMTFLRVQFKEYKTVARVIQTRWEL